MSRSRYRFTEGCRPHFLTCTVVGWLPIFTRTDTVNILLDSWRFLQAHNRLTLFGYVILENHLHLVASADDLSKEIGDFKGFTARKIIDLLESRKVETLLKQLRYHKEAHKTQSDYQVWQEGSHPQLIETDDMMRQKLEYMHFNPVKRGYVDKPRDWRLSSARNYEGEPGLIEVVTQWGWGR
jgi:REP-associated tyrosine transposase